MIDVNTLRKDFPMIQKSMDKKPLVYFDNAATTFKPQSVINAILEYYTNYSVNVHRGDYEIAYQITQKVEQARQNMADFIGADVSEIVYMSGATEALNQIAYGLGTIKSGDIILTTEAEHASNILPWFRIARDKGALIRYFEMDDEGIIQNIDEVITRDVKIVTLAHISNVLGHLNPIKKIVQKAHEVGAIVVLDAAQSIPHLKVNVKELGIDFMAFSGHKMLGPTGIGVLYGKKELLENLEPLKQGGGANARFNMQGEVQLKNAPTKFEAGTPHVAGILGLDAAIDYLTKIGLENIHQYELELRAYAYQKLSAMDHIVVYNPNAKTGIISFNVRGIFAQDTCAYLGHHGFALRAGNHCAKVLHEVIGTNESCRLSLYFYNTKEEIDRFLRIIQDITLEKTVDLYI